MSAGVHHVASAFSLQTDAYEKARPTYPEDAVECIVNATELRSPRADGQPKRILDLASGTGKFTRLLARSLFSEGIERAADERFILQAAEPIEGMRTAFAKSVPSVECLACSAAGLGTVFEAGQIDVLTVAQAFHWFANLESLKEMHRAIAPGGYLVLIWNDLNREIDWIREARETFEIYEGDAPQFRHQRWRDVFEQQANLPEDHPERLSFSNMHPLVPKTFANIQASTLEQLWQRVVSISYIGALDSEKHRQIKEQLVNVVESHLPAVKANAEATFDLQYTTNVFIFRKTA